MVFDAGHGSPRVVEGGRIKRSGDGGYGDRGVGSARRRLHGAANDTAQIIVLHHVKTEAAGA